MSRLAFALLDWIYISVWDIILFSGHRFQYLDMDDLSICYLYCRRALEECSGHRLLEVRKTSTPHD